MPSAEWPLSTAREPRLRSRAALGTAALYAPLLLLLAYLLTLALQLGRLLATTYLNADAASAPVIGELFGSRAAGSQTILGHLGWYSTLLFERLTHSLPLHRQIWELSPYAMALCSALLIAWGASRVAGRWAGAIALTLIVCLGPELLSLLLVLNNHAPSWFTLALLGAFVVLLEQRGQQLSWRLLTPLTLIVGVLLGANASSDVLLSIGGGLPMLLAVGAVALLSPSRRSTRAALYASASGIVAIASGLLLRAYMHHQHVIAAPDPRTNLLATAEAIGQNFRLWWQSIVVLGNSNFFGQSLGLSTALALASGALTLLAVFLTLPIAQRQLRGPLAARRQARGADGRGDTGRPAGTGRRADHDARTAWCLFWASSALLLTLAFILSGTPEDLASSRYLVGVLFAAAALVPLLGRRSALGRVLVTLGATLYAFTGWLALAQERIQPPPSPSDQLANQVAKFAREEHIAIGYAGYWDAAPITWASHMQVQVFPVQECDGNQHLCGFELHLISSWYTPRPGQRSFLLSDPAYPAMPSAPTPDLGKPIAGHQIGQVTMYVYSYDIGAKLFAL